MPEPKEFRSYSGLVPPHLNKSYSQHPIAQMILAPATGRKPNHIVMWGVGLTESDTELVALYRSWGAAAQRCDVINPSDEVGQRVRELLSCEVRQFHTVAEWDK